MNWVDSTGGTSAAFDFTTKGILQEAVGRQEYWYTHRALNTSHVLSGDFEIQKAVLLE